MKASAIGSPDRGEGLRRWLWAGLRQGRGAKNMVITYRLVRSGHGNGDRVNRSLGGEGRWDMKLFLVSNSWLGERRVEIECTGY